ncbi:MAG TPA: RNA polymerase sigma factor [Bryobacteraceae bacterium]|nr:RNA polymerase sigma factor [Bryobacteraceae bacterium]
MNPKIHDELGDGELLRLSGTGDEKAFMTLYRRHQGSIFRFALHMSGQRETAEEVTQEVFLALLSEPELYVEERGALQGYLIGVARNKVRRALSQSRFVDFLSEGPSEISIFEGLCKERDLVALRRAILSLPPNYREVVVLCDLEEMEYAEVARQLGCALGTVRSRLHRARAILGARLRKKETCPA